MDIEETFFTRIGCMDGRAQTPVHLFGEQKFNAKYPDTITDAGEVKKLADNPSEEYLKELKSKLDISINVHKTKGILVHGHQDCAGNPVDDNRHKEDIKKSVEVIKGMVPSSLPVIGLFVKRSLLDPQNWEVEELS
jgi:carbonic anhydrase